MKQFLYLILFALSLLGCSDKEDSYFVSVDKTSLVIESEGGRQIVQVKSNCEWSVECAEDWVNLIKGSDYVELSFDSNETFSERNSSIFVSGGDITNTITITQKQNFGFVADQTDIAVNGYGGEVKISLKTNIENVQIETSEWIKVLDSENTRSLSEKYFKFFVDANGTKEERKGEIAFLGEGVDIVYSINQDVINPDKVYALPWPEMVTEFGRIEVPLAYSPESASLKNISFKSSNESVCDVWIEEGMLVLDVHQSGETNISCFILEDKIWSLKLISKDVINPSRIEALPWPEAIALGKIEIPLTIYPDNASLKNVSFKSSNESICKASLQGENLILEALNNGDVNISCLVLGDEIWSLKTKCYNDGGIQIWIDDDNRGTLIGNDIMIKSNLPLSLFDFSIETPGLISANGNKMLAINVGEGKIIATERKTQTQFELFPKIADVIMYNEVYRQNWAYEGFFRITSNNRIYIYHITLIDHNSNNVFTVYGDQVQGNNTTNVCWNYSYSPNSGLFKEDLEKHSFACKYAFFREDGTFEDRFVAVPFKSE